MVLLQLNAVCFWKSRVVLMDTVIILKPVYQTVFNSVLPHWLAYCKFASYVPTDVLWFNVQVLVHNAHCIYWQLIEVNFLCMCSVFLLVALWHWLLLCNLTICWQRLSTTITLYLKTSQFVVSSDFVIRPPSLMVVVCTLICLMDLYPKYFQFPEESDCYHLHITVGSSEKSQLVTVYAWNDAHLS